MNNLTTSLTHVTNYYKPKNDCRLSLTLKIDLIRDTSIVSLKLEALLVIVLDVLHFFNWYGIHTSDIK